MFAALISGAVVLVEQAAAPEPDQNLDIKLMVMAIAVAASLFATGANFFHTRHLYKKKFRQDYELQEFRDLVKTPINDSWRQFSVVAEEVRAILDSATDCKKRAEEAANVEKSIFTPAYDDLYGVLRKVDSAEFIEGDDWYDCIEEQIDRVFAGFDKLANSANSGERQRLGAGEILNALREIDSILQSKINSEARRIVDGRKIV